MIDRHDTHELHRPGRDLFHRVLSGIWLKGVFNGFMTVGQARVSAGYFYLDTYLFIDEVAEQTDGELNMEILPQLYQVDGVQGNCYILERDGLVLIDTGLPRNSKKILSFIRDSLKRDPKDLKFIIITHYHADHTGNVAELRRVTGAKVAIHEADADFLAGRKKMPPLMGLRGRVLGLLLFLWPCEPVNPDILLHDDDNISGLRCIHTPGHTPGSICLHDRDLRVVFCGDVLITKNGNVSGPPPSATPDIAEAMKSAKKISLLDFDILLSGHGIPVRPGAWEKVATFCASQKQ